MFFRRRKSRFGRSPDADRPEVFDPYADRGRIPGEEPFPEPRNEPEEDGPSVEWIEDEGEEEEEEWVAEAEEWMEGPVEPLVEEEVAPDEALHDDRAPGPFDEFSREERAADGPYPAEEIRPGVGWEGPARRADGRGAAAGAFVVSTLLSRKPAAGAKRAVGWTLALAVLTSALYWWGPPEWAAVLPASGETVFGRAEVWRLFTSMAAHADALHLLSNSVLLTALVYFAYGAFGPSLYPGGAVPAGALALAVTLEGYAPSIQVVGASGLVYLLAGACLTLYVLVERRLSVAKRLVRVVGFSLLVLVPTSIRPEVSYRAHAIGFFFGVCLGLTWFLARRDAIRAAERWESPD